MSMDSATVLDFYLPHIQKMFPDFSRSSIESHFIWQCDYAQPIVETGYRHLIPDIQSPIDNLLVCTMAQIYPHDRQVSNGVEIARQAASTLVAKVGQEQVR